MKLYEEINSFLNGLEKKQEKIRESEQQSKIKAIKKSLEVNIAALDGPTLKEEIRHVKNKVSHFSYSKFNLYYKFCNYKNLYKEHGSFELFNFLTDEIKEMILEVAESSFENFKFDNELIREFYSGKICFENEKLKLLINKGKHESELKILSPENICIAKKTYKEIFFLVLKSELYPENSSFYVGEIKRIWVESQFSVPFFTPNNKNIAKRSILDEYFSDQKDFVVNKVFSWKEKHNTQYFDDLVKKHAAADISVWHKKGFFPKDLYNYMYLVNNESFKLYYDRMLKESKAFFYKNKEQLEDTHYNKICKTNAFSNLENISSDLMELDKQFFERCQNKKEISHVSEELSKLDKLSSLGD